MGHTKIKFPDGQISCKIDNKSGDLHEIRERINSYEDLIYIKSLSEAYNHNSSVRQNLFIPCMFGQRSDRRFENTQSFDLKIIADIINSCNFGRVEIFDPHSDVTLALVNNSVKKSSFEYVQKAVERIKSCPEFQEPLVLVSPDAGAYKKVFEYGEKLGLEVVAAVKHRDLEGNIQLKFLSDVEGKECLIIDDLCDGGYTFELLGDALREQGAKWVSLYVSHGYFSKGFTNLSKVIDHIYCTNSVKDLSDWVEEKDKIFTCNHIPGKDYITQFKII